MTVPVPDLMPRLPMLEKPRADVDLTDEEAAALVTYGATAWSDHWASTASDWVDQGVWSQGVAEALRRTAKNEACSQRTRQRAWRYVKQHG